MKSFLKYLLASFIGTFIALFLVVIFAISSFMGSMMNSFSNEMKETKKVKVKENSILEINFNEEVTDKPITNPFDFSGLDFSSFDKEYVTLKSYLDHIKKAKNDPKIKGIYLNFKGFSLSLSKAEEIRNALLDFKRSGKFIIADADMYTQYQYYIATVADKIYLTPEGALLFQGMNAQIMFYKRLLEKLDVKPEVIRHGKFKSAVEPFILDSMSNANYLQTKVYVSSLWNHILEGIAATRNIPVDSLNKYADLLLIDSDSAALKYGFVDGLKYKDQVLAELKKMMNVKKDDDLNFVTMSKYANTPIFQPITKNKIAIVYAVGEIAEGEGKKDDKIYPYRLVKEIEKARKDKDVKAIVLRVNSPGGSALSAEIIWRELKLAQKEKPLIISMGDLAASGGYYISTAGDYIVADPTTITGSIGVFGLLWNAKGLLNDKVGINVDGYKTNKYADLGSFYRPLTDYERQKMQNLVEKTYHTFLRRVADGRNMSIADVDSIGQGRVWSGINAKEIGLVDEFGGLDKAIKIAADRARVKKYKIVEYPKKKEFWEMLLESLQGGDVVKSMLSAYLPEKIKEQKAVIEFIKSNKGVMALMPYSIVFN
jgi:protease-4